jgi:hypothetical protein
VIDFWLLLDYIKMVIADDDDQGKNNERGAPQNFPQTGLTMQKVQRETRDINLLINRRESC